MLYAILAVSTMLIFCLIVAGQFTNWLHWLISLVVVVWIYISILMMGLVGSLNRCMVRFGVEQV